jgi:hypothetical protein
MIILRQHTFSEKSEKDTKAEKTKTAGKVMAGAGAGTYIGARALADKTKKDFVKWTEDAINRGAMIADDSGYMSFNSKENAERADKYMKKAEKIIKSANIAKNAGIALGAAGVGTYLYGRHKSKKTKKD